MLCPFVTGVEVNLIPNCYLFWGELFKWVRFEAATRKRLDCSERSLRIAYKNIEECNSGMSSVTFIMLPRLQGKKICETSTGLATVVYYVINVYKFSPKLIIHHTYFLNGGSLSRYMGNVMFLKVAL